MGWWRIGEGDDVMGDGPADEITTVLRAVSDAGTRDGQPPPLAAVLGILDAVLRDRAERVLGDPAELQGGRLAAELDDGTVVEADPPEKVDSELARQVFRGLENVALEYQDTELERKPRLSELLAVILFPLAPDPGEYVTVPGGAALRRLFLAR